MKPIRARSALLPTFPVAITINIDVETGDLAAADAGKGGAGLFGRYSYGRYGLREGFWRLLAMLDAEGVSATFFVEADDAKRHPGMIEAIVERGHEVAARGAFLDKPEQDGPGQLDIISASKNMLKEISGHAPRGWRSSNGLVTAEALETLAAEGFAYDSNFENDDYPYVFADGSGRRMAELPVFGYLTDATFYGAFHGPERVRKVWLEEFDALYDAGGYVNLTLNLHGDYGSARAVRVDVAADLIVAIGRKPGTRFMRCDQIADALLADTGFSDEPFPANLPAPISL